MNRFSLYLIFFVLFGWGLPIPNWAQEFVSVSELEKPQLSEKHFEETPGDSAGWHFDVLHYDVQIEPNFETGFLQGSCRILLKLKGTLPHNRLYFNLKNLQVDSVRLGTLAAEKTQKSGTLIISLPPDFAGTDTLSVQIDYSGFPQNDGFGGYFSSPKIVFTVGEGLYTSPPSMTRYWMPCVDRPSDKATLTLRVRVPAAISVGSNGLLQKTTLLTSTLKEVDWEEKFPIATYLMSVGASHFARFRQVFLPAQGDSIPLEYFVYPSDSTNVRNDVHNLPDMLRFFSEKFGPYPFKKYGMLEAPMQGAMEHQTLTTISDRLFTGDRRYEGVYAHELAHQWWGDCVTLTDWGEIWLNEGFATYSDMLYTEHAYGEKAFRERLDKAAFLYFREDEQVGRFPVLNPLKMWGHTVYEKGAWVLHMLRGVVGTARFFKILQTYHQRYAYGNATTVDFQSVAEELFGKPLDWFFHQWLFEAGYPTYTFQWKPLPLSDGEVKVTVTVRQIQTLAPLFKMPVTLRFVFDDSTIDRVLWVEQTKTDSSFRFSQVPQRVIFDPEDFILKKLIDYSETYPKSAFGLEEPFPNPFKPEVDLAGLIVRFWNRASGQPVRLEIFNLLGQKVRTLLSGAQPPGAGKVIWHGKSDWKDQLPSGLYFCLLHQGHSRSVKKIVLER